MRSFNKALDSVGVLNANRFSEPIPLKSIFGFSMSATITGTPTGTIKLQASNDADTNETQYNTSLLKPPAVLPGSTSWVDIEDSDFAVSAAGTTFWNVSDVNYAWVRVAYVDGSSGASTATAVIRINAKGV